MSFNIVDLIKDQISDQVLGQMGNVLGTEGSQTTGALAGALPGLLSGILSASGSAAGAGNLFQAAQKQDDNLLGNMGNLLGGDQASAVASQGNSTLSSILGSGALGQLAGVVANFSGISRGNSSSLMGMLAPFVIGVIKKKIVEGGMDAGSMASMLSGQKDNVAAAMPQGFSDQLQSAGFFDSIASAPQAASATSGASASDAASASTTASATASSSPVASHDSSSAKTGGGFMKWLLPLVAVVVVGWLGLNFLSDKSGSDDTDGVQATVEGATAEAGNAATSAVEGATAEASNAAAGALEAAQDAMPEGVDLTAISGGLEGVFGSTTDALSGVTDVESAQSAIPAIEEATSKLGGMSDLITRLPEAAQGPIASIVSNGMTAIQPLIEKVTAIPGVGAVLEPVLQPMLDMLSGMTE